MSKFKVGDKVEVVGHAGFYRGSNGLGTVGNILNIYENGNIQIITDKGFTRTGCTEDLKLIISEPAKTITQNGYEYRLVEPVVPEWVKDGSWVIGKGSNELYKITKSESGQTCITGFGSTNPIEVSAVSKYYRPFTKADWKWGMWAMYEGKRIFVMGVKSSGSIKISHPSFERAGFACAMVSAKELTPTF